MSKIPTMFPCPYIDGCCGGSRDSTLLGQEICKYYEPFKLVLKKAQKQNIHADSFTSFFDKGNCEK